MERLKRFKEEYRIRERKNNLYQVRVCACEWIDSG